MASEEFVTTEAAAEILGYTPQHVRRLVRQGTLQGEKVGRDWLILTDSLQRFIASKENIDLPLDGENERD